jgi:hypothetical protein
MRPVIQKMKNYLSTLSGWQRLYMVVIIFIYLPASWIIAPDYISDKINTEEFMKIASPSVSEGIKSGVIYLDATNIHDESVPNLLTGAIFYVIDYDKHMNKFAISSSVSTAYHNELRNKIRDIYINEYKKRKIIKLWLNWYFPVLIGGVVIYIFGISLAWVKNGFIKNSPF